MSQLQPLSGKPLKRLSRRDSASSGNVWRRNANSGMPIFGPSQLHGAYKGTFDWLRPSARTQSGVLYDCGDLGQPTESWYEKIVTFIKQPFSPRSGINIRAICTTWVLANRNGQRSISTSARSPIFDIYDVENADFSLRRGKTPRPIGQGEDRSHLLKKFNIIMIAGRRGFSYRWELIFILRPGNMAVRSTIPSRMRLRNLSIGNSK